MEFIIINIVLPVVLGIFVEWLIRRSEKINKNRILSATIGVLVAFILGFSLLFIPPVNIDGVTWCTNQDASTRITGRLTTSLLGLSVAGESLQIKVFEAGKSDPLGPEVFTTTNAEGTFSVDLPHVSLTNGSSYVINVAYRYSRFILGERWQISNFNRGKPAECP